MLRGQVPVLQFQALVVMVMVVLTVAVEKAMVAVAEEMAAAVMVRAVGVVGTVAVAMERAAWVAVGHWLAGRVAGRWAPVGRVAAVAVTAGRERLQR